MASPKKILMIVTSHDKLGESGERTGFWLEELAAPYREFVNAGAAVDIASPRGGRPPVDPKSESSKNEAVIWFLADRDAASKLASTIAIADVVPSYDAYFVVGGHGAMWDLAESAAVQGLLARAFDGGQVVAAVCHGPGALVNVRLASGDPLVKGRRVAGFSNEEEAAVGLTKVVPFSLETRLRELGGHYERGPMWGAFAVRDGKLVTGQNPSSSAAVAQETLAALESS
jgi:putative intracellular protease/amidase